MLSARVLDHIFFKALKIFYAKIPFSATRHQITFFYGV